LKNVEHRNFRAEGDDVSAQRRKLIIAGAAAASCAVAARAGAQKTAPAVTPNEELMHEHGLVTRVILIYRRSIELLNANEKVDAAALGEAAQIIARVIHGNHEVEEENIIFPLVEKSANLQALTATLRGQHNAARAITSAIGKNANAAGIADSGRRNELINAMQSFAHMYEPHGAYEDTVVYPAFRQAVSTDQYQRFAQQFQNNEHRVSGEGGFRKATATLAQIERGLHMDLPAYTRQIQSTPAEASNVSPKK
jgi:hemerythrin-like domain-containing protein